jgi:uncharacterized membrane protein
VGIVLGFVLGLLMDVVEGALLGQHAQAVYQQVVVLKLMPMNNSTQITDEERQLIARWQQAGAPLQ